MPLEAFLADFFIYFIGMDLVHSRNPCRPYTTTTCLICSFHMRKFISFNFTEKLGLNDILDSKHESIVEILLVVIGGDSSQESM